MSAPKAKAGKVGIGSRLLRTRWPLASSISMMSAEGGGGAVSAWSGVTTTGTSWAAGNAVSSSAKRFRQPKT